MVLIWYMKTLLFLRPGNGKAIQVCGDEEKCNSQFVIIAIVICQYSLIHQQAAVIVPKSTKIL